MTRGEFTGVTLNDLDPSRTEHGFKVIGILYRQ